MTLDEYIQLAREPIKKFCIDHLPDYERPMPTHPGKQNLSGGKKVHTLQVIDKALELNQEFGEQDIIETCLVHDIRNCESLELLPHQRLAIAATKGKAVYEDWRHTPYYRFVVLILIADMWSAFINIQDRVK